MPQKQNRRLACSNKKRKRVSSPQARAYPLASKGGSHESEQDRAFGVTLLRPCFFSHVQLRLADVMIYDRFVKLLLAACLLGLAVAHGYVVEIFEGEFAVLEVAALAAVEAGVALGAHLFDG